MPDDADLGLERYLLDHYGACAMSVADCACLRDGWLGTDCPHWQPWGVKTLAELAARLKQIQRQEKADG